MEQKAEWIPWRSSISPFSNSDHVVGCLLSSSSFMDIYSLHGTQSGISSNNTTEIAIGASHRCGSVRLHKWWIHEWWEWLKHFWATPNITVTAKHFVLFQDGKHALWLILATQVYIFKKDIYNFNASIIHLYLLITLTLATKQTIRQCDTGLFPHRSQNFSIIVALLFLIYIYIS